MTSQNSLLNVDSMFMNKIDNSLGQSGQRVGRAELKFDQKSNFLVIFRRFVVSFSSNFFHIFWVFLMRWFWIWWLECLKTPGKWVKIVKKIFFEILLYFVFLYVFDDFDAWRRIWPLTRAFWSTLIIKFGISASKSLKMWKKFLTKKFPADSLARLIPKNCLFCS